MRITKKWLRETKDALQHNLRRLGMMSEDEVLAELKRIWPAYQEDGIPTTSHHRMAMAFSFMIDKAFSIAVD